jgi:hypothetical protein
MFRVQKAEGSLTQRRVKSTGAEAPLTVGMHAWCIQYTSWDFAHFSISSSACPPAFHKTIIIQSTCPSRMALVLACDHALLLSDVRNVA